MPLVLRFACCIGLLLVGAAIVIVSWLQMLSGEQDVSKDSPGQSEKVFETVRRTIDFGDVRGVASRELVTGWAEATRILKIDQSCGCTKVGLEEGQVLPVGRPLELKLNLAGKPVGIGSQSLRLKLDNHVQLALTLNYNHKPAPFCEPNYVMLSSAESPVVVDFFFPAEDDIHWLEIDRPEELMIRRDEVQAPSGSSGCASRVRLCIAAVRRPEQRRGSLTLRFSSVEKPEFIIPYLYVDNN